VEKDTFGRVLQIGHAAIQQLLALQGDGDLGESVATAEGRRLKRSEEPAERLLRAVFGEHILDILEHIGLQHRKWLVSLWKEYRLIQEPILDNNGRVIAEPLFWFMRDGKRFACFPPDSVPEVEKLNQYGIILCEIGKPLESPEQPSLFQ
jgi:hypothetical protein